MESHLDIDNEYLSNTSLEPNTLQSSFAARLHNSRSHGWRFFVKSLTQGTPVVVPSHSDRLCVPTHSNGNGHQIPAAAKMWFPMPRSISLLLSIGHNGFSADIQLVQGLLDLRLWPRRCPSPRPGLRPSSLSPSVSLLLLSL